jgi:TATA-binding protein-associated factor Taf7
MQKEQIVKNVMVVFDAAYRSNLLEMDEIPAVIETKQNIFGIMQSHDQQATLLEEKDKAITEKDLRIAELEEENKVLKQVDEEAKNLNNKKVMEMNVVTDEDGSDEDEEETEEEAETEEAEEEQTDSVANSDIPEASKKLDKIKSIKRAKR